MPQSRILIPPRSLLAREDVHDDVDLARFRRDGFIVLRGVLDRGGVAAARARLWGCLPPRFRPDDARTWRGAVEDESGSIDLFERRGRVKLRGALRSDPRLLDLLPHDPTIRAAVAALMAPHAVATPVTVRGIYLTFPMPELSQAHGHVDLHDYAVGAVAYLDEVPANGGGLLVWPGTQHDRATPLAERQHVEPVDVVELTGAPGDVVLYDRHLVHAPGRNRLPRVRSALLCDFRLADG
jgi:hypothetical protein